MHRIFTIKIGWMFVIYAFLDLICMGMGMGIPIFCIVFGLLVGWYIARWITARALDAKQALTKMLMGAGLTSAFTFVLMACLWGPVASMLFDPAEDLANFGIPLILYEPEASLIGWLVLMIIISPFLQCLMTLFGSHVTLLWSLSKSKRGK